MYLKGTCNTFFMICTDRMPPGDLNFKIWMHKLHSKKSYRWFKINFYYSQSDQSIPKTYANKFKNAMIQAISNNNQKLSQKGRMPVTEHNTTV